MSSGRQLLSVVGMVGANIIFPGSGFAAAAGGIIGGELGGFIDGPPQGPRLTDLSAPQLEYGGKIPRLYGGPKWFEVGTLWASEKREDSETVGGKGGDSGVEQFSYRCDLLLRVCESRQGTPCEVVAITGVEVDGVVVWTNLADASAEARANSLNQENWSDMQVLLGHEDQAPWSVLEAAVGAANANAHRGYFTVGLSDFLLADGGQPRRIRIQAITVGTLAEGPEFLLAHFDGTAGSSVFANEVGADGSGASVELAAAAAQFGATGAASTANIGVLANWPVAVQITQATPLTMEGWFEFSQDPNSSFNLMALRTATGLTAAVSWANSASPDEVAWQFQFAGEVTTSAYMPIEESLVHPVGTRFHLRFTFNPDTNALVLALNGVEILAGTYSGASFTQDVIDAEALEDSGTFAGVIRCDEIRYTRELHPASGFAVPSSAFTTSSAWTPGTVDLRDILEYEATRCTPLTAANIDFSAAEGIPVECHVAIGSAAEAMQPLLTRFWFDLYSTDKLYLVRRGGAVEQSIAHRWTGAGVGGRSEPFAGLVRSNDVEVARKKAITYADVLKDGETDTRTGDREAVGAHVDTLPMNLHMRPSEAQGLADTATADARVGAHTATVRLGPRHGLRVLPGSVLEFTDHKGNAWRALVRRMVWNRWVWDCEVRLDDPNVLQAAGIAVDLDQRALTVAAPPEATLYVLDIPLLRVQDDAPGEYVAVTQTGRFRGVAIRKSSDDVTYLQVAEVTQRATAGSCDSELPAHTGWGWDNRSVLTVTLDDGSGGTLSSATKAAIEASRSLNLAAVGVQGRQELLQFATATLITGTTYELRGLLRNLLGTELYSGLHEAGDDFVLINGALVNVPGAVSDLGQTRYYKAVPAGRSAGSITPTSITCEEQRLLPYAPIGVRNDAGTVRWDRRSRVEGAIGLDPPLGEVLERYDAELYDGATLEDSASALTGPEWTPVDPAGLTVRVYQLNDLVGRGHVAEKAIP